MAIPIPEDTRVVLERLYAEDAAQRAAGLPSAQRTRNIDRESGRFLGMLVHAMNAQHVLEIGSSNGVSTIWLAIGARLTGGQITGTELIEDRAAEANANLTAAGLAAHALVHSGSAAEITSTLLGPFDLVFIDAEKDDYSAHFEATFSLVRSGGVILADNVISHDCSAYQAMLRKRDDVDTVTLPIERGIEFTTKR